MSGTRKALLLDLDDENIQPVDALDIDLGGTGASDASTARTNLGAQQAHAKLTDIAGLSPSANNVLKWNGTNIVAGAVTGGMLEEPVTGSHTFSGAITLANTTTRQITGQSGYKNKTHVESTSTDATTFSLYDATIVNNATSYYVAKIFAVLSDGTSSGYSLNCLLKRVSGSVTILNTSGMIPDATFIGVGDMAVTTAIPITSVVYNLSGSNIRIRCTGIAATNIKWFATVSVSVAFSN